MSAAGLLVQVALCSAAARPKLYQFVSKMNRVLPLKRCCHFLSPSSSDVQTHQSSMEARTPDGRFITFGEHLDPDRLGVGGAEPLFQLSR